MRTFVVTAVLLAACGISPVPLDEYPGAVRDAHCSYLARCGGIESFETCRKLDVGFHFRLTASDLAAIEMGKTHYDGENARRCLDAQAARSCDTTSQSNRVLADACLGIMIGTQHDGESCARDTECISGLCDAPAACGMACCTGVCVGDTAPGRAKVGESCEAAACVDTAFCDDQTMTCVALSGRNGFCVVDAQCSFGLNCEQGGMCVAPPVVGQSCTGPCRDEGTACNASGTCVKVGFAGAPCATSSDCASAYRCDDTRHCSAGIALGQPCVDGQRCADDRAFCDIADGALAGTCVVPKPDGQRCANDPDCASQTCNLDTMLCAAEPVCI